MGIERAVQIQLAKRLGASCKREYRIGRNQADIVTEFEIIEIKDIRVWWYAIGQLLYYQAKSGMFDKRLRLHLFGDCDNDEWFYITTICSRLNILVTREEEADLIPKTECHDSLLSRIHDFELAMDSIELELQELKVAILMLDEQKFSLIADVNYATSKLDKIEAHLVDYLAEVLTPVARRRGKASIEAEMDITNLALSQSTVNALNKIADDIYSA